MQIRARILFLLLAVGVCSRAQATYVVPTIELVVTCTSPSACTIKAQPDTVSIYDSNGIIQTVNWSANKPDWAVDFKNGTSPCTNGGHFQNGGQFPCVILPSCLPLLKYYSYSATAGGIFVDPKIIHSAAVALLSHPTPDEERPALSIRSIQADQVTPGGQQTPQAFCLAISGNTAAFQPDVAAPSGQKPKDLIVKQGDYITWSGSGVWSVQINGAACQEGTAITSSKGGYCTAAKLGRYTYTFSDSSTKKSKKKKFKIRVIND